MCIHVYKKHIYIYDYVCNDVGCICVRSDLPLCISFTFCSSLVTCPTCFMICAPLISPASIRGSGALTSISRYGSHHLGSSPFYTSTSTPGIGHQTARHQLPKAFMAHHSSFRLLLKGGGVVASGTASFKASSLFVGVSVIPWLTGTLVLCCIWYDMSFT